MSEVVSELLLDFLEMPYQSEIMECIRVILLGATLHVHDALSRAEDAPPGMLDKGVRWAWLVIAAVTMASVILWPVLVIGNSAVPQWALFACGVIMTLALAPRCGVTKRGRVGITVCTALVMLFPTLIVAFQTVTTTVKVFVPPPGHGSCRVVIVETGFMMAGSGSAGALNSAVGFVTPQAEYDADDAGRPMTRDGGRVTWARSGPSVELGGAAWFVEGDGTLHC